MKGSLSLWCIPGSKHTEQRREAQESIRHRQLRRQQSHLGRSPQEGFGKSPHLGCCTSLGPVPCVTPGAPPQTNPTSFNHFPGRTCWGERQWSWLRESKVGMEGSTGAGPSAGPGPKGVPPRGACEGDVGKAQDFGMLAGTEKNAVWQRIKSTTIKTVRKMKTQKK